VGLRRRAPTFLRRLKSGLPAGGTAFLASSGVAGTVISVISATGTVVAMPVIWITGAVCVGTGAVVTLVRGRLKHLPDRIIDDASADGHYTASYCSQQSLSEANDLTRPYYRHEYVSDVVAESWRRRNPAGFVAIHNSKAELCASFGVIAVEPSFMGQFIRGRVRDNSLGSDDVLSFDSSKTSPTLYISGVVVRDPEAPAGAKRACVMVWTALCYIRRLYGLRRRRVVYALAVSRQSENLLKHLGFTMASAAHGRACSNGCLPPLRSIAPCCKTL